MKYSIFVENECEGKLIEAALSDPVCRASVITYAVLKRLPSDRSRQRVLSYVMDVMDENEHARATPDATPI